MKKSGASSPSHFVYHSLFFKRNISQVTLSDWFIGVLHLFVVQCLASSILKLTRAFSSNRLSTQPKRQDKNVNISRTKRAFNMK